jgi:hypothetical protein
MDQEARGFTLDPTRGIGPLFAAQGGETPAFLVQAIALFSTAGLSCLVSVD